MLFREAECVYPNGLMPGIFYGAYLHISGDCGILKYLEIV